MPPDEDVERAAAVLRAGGLVAIPTETVYGLAADAESPRAVGRIFTVKGRPSDHPLIVHLSGADELPRWADAPGPLAWALARAFWPGPLTLVLRRSSRPPAIVTGGLPTIGLRVPAHPRTLALLRAFGGGLAAPSANRFGRLSPTTASHVRQDLGSDVDFVLDGGPCAVGVESTIVDVSSDTPAILRPGGVTKEELEAALGRPVAVRAEGGPRTPGRLPSHYAPRARVELVGPGASAARAAALAATGARVGLLELTEPLSSTAVAPPVIRRRVGLSGLDEAARDLYAALRALDEAGCDVIVSSLPEEAGIGLALADRLRRAAGPRED